ncbi:MAG: hypothetical protein GY838_12125 [bacterium]|nr:hypothetical protein [bacterium]
MLTLPDGHETVSGVGTLLNIVRTPCLRWPLLAVAVLLAVCLVGRLDETPVGAVVDDAHYVEMARSLAEGRGAVLHVGPESTPADTVFPPGLPLLLAPLAGLFPTSLTVLKLVPVLAVLLLVPVCLAWPGGEDRPHLRRALAAVTVLNPWVIAHGVRIVSDLPYTALSLAAAIFFLRTAERITTGPVRWIALGVLVGAAILVRTIGLALLAAMLLHLLFDRRFVRAVQLTMGAAALVALPAVLRLSPAPLGRVYGQQLVDHAGDPGARLAFMKTNLLGYAQELPSAVLPVFGKVVAAWGEGRSWSGFLPAAQIFITLIVVGAVLAGLTVAGRRGDPAARRTGRFWALYLGLYGLALLNFDGYPSGVQLRLLLPVLPILFWYLLCAADAWRSRLVLALLLAALLGTALAHNTWRLARPLRQVTDASGRGFVDPGAGAAWILDHTEPEDVILVQGPLERHIHLRRPTIGPGALDADALAARLAEHGVDLILVGPQVHGRPRRLDEDGAVLQEILRGAPLRYPVIHEEAEEAVTLHGVADGVGRCRWAPATSLPVR